MYVGRSLVTSLKSQALAAVQGRTELRQVDKRLKACVLGVGQMLEGNFKL